MLSFVTLPDNDFPFDVILLRVEVSPSSGIADEEDFRVDLFADLFIKCGSARGNCNQNSASDASPKIAAAKANLMAEPLCTTAAYRLTLSSSSSMQP